VIKAIAALSRILIPDAGPWFVTALAVAPRYLLAVALMLVFRGRRPWPSAREARQGLIIGAFAAAGSLLQTDGLQHTDASVSAFLTQFSAILIPAWLAVTRRRNPGMRVWACCALVVAGVGILGHFDWRSLRFGRGEWETLLSAVFYMGQILWVGRKEYADNRPGEVTLVMFAIQAAAFVVLAAGTATRAHALLVPWASPAWVGLTLVLTVVCTIGAFSLMTKWQPRIPYCIEPVFASVFALFVPALLSAWAAVEYPNEQASWSLVVGGCLITVANVLIHTKPAEAEMDPN
jgi:hypothetical protein